MSRIGKKPVPIPKGVTTTLDGQRLTVIELIQVLAPCLCVALAVTVGLSRAHVGSLP